MATISSTALLSIVLVVVVAAGGLAGYVYYTERPMSPPVGQTVSLDDNVTVNYIGLFGSGPEAGKVFDTSIYSVATDPIGYPKSLDFQLRGDAKNYTPLPVHVGPNTPSSGYTLGNLTFIGVVTGFWQGLLGMPGNQTRTLVIPPSLGYGPESASCLVRAPLVFSVPIVQTYLGGYFLAHFPGVLAAPGAPFTDPEYGWSAIVLSANVSYVTIERLPEVGQVSYPHGWPQIVSSISPTANGSGNITVRNELTASGAGHIAGVNGTAPAGCPGASSKFIVSAVDLVNGTYTEDYNQEVQGQTLIFQVSVVNIFAKSAGTVA